MSNFNVIESNGKIIKAWSKGVAFEEKAIEQLKTTASMPFVQPYIAAMPDCHWGMGSTVGSVVPTIGAVIPACVGVDIGCGMMAARTNLDYGFALSNAANIRAEIERVVPHGRTNNGGPGDRGAWYNVPKEIQKIYENEFESTDAFENLQRKHPKAVSKNIACQLGTLGTGNHFIEVARDKQYNVWFILHSGSRGFGNRIGSYFTELAKQMCEKFFVNLPDKDLAYLPQDTPEFGDYISALNMAQRYAWRNREIMMKNITEVLKAETSEFVHCHHNFMREEKHFGKKVLLTRKGAVSAQSGQMVIIPGSMGASTYIARGLGSPDSFCSCSHGAGRAMGRREAERRFTVADHVAATQGIECHKGAEVIDETPAAYKDINAVLRAQSDLVEPVEVLTQFINVKGWEK